MKLDGILRRLILLMTDSIVKGRRYDAAKLYPLIEKHKSWLELRLPHSTMMADRLRLVAAQLDGVKLDNCRLDEAVIEASWIRSASLRGITATSASFSGTDFTATDLSDSRLDLANLRGTRFHRATLKNVRFLKADFSSAETYGPTELQDCQVLSGDFSEARLTGTAFLGCSLANVVFDKADLTNARFDFSDIGEVTVRNANLMRADFRRATFVDGSDELVAELARHGAQISRRPNMVELEIKLSSHAEWLHSFGNRGARANFRDQNLARESIFIDTDLSGADFRGANLAFTDFSGSRLICADFRGAYLNGARFDNTDIREAFFDGSYQFKMSFNGADVRNASGFAPMKPSVRENIGINSIPLPTPGPRASG